MKPGKSSSKSNRNKGLVQTPKDAPLGSKSKQKPDARKISTSASEGPKEMKHRASNAIRIVTGFRGAVVPEHRGHMPRVGHTAVMYNRNFYIYGGVNAKGQYNTHLYALEKRSLQWEEVRTFGTSPDGRANHSCVLAKNKMYIFGGNRDLEVLNDMFAFDFDARKWEKVFYDKAQSPGPVFLHAAAYVPPLNSMVVLGGFHQREHNIYLGHMFDIKTKTWNGISSPPNVNPQQIQTVNAIFHEPSVSIYVMGLIKYSQRDVNEISHMTRTTEPAPMQPGSLHIVNVFSWVWQEVVTTSSPESPIPFRMDTAWPLLMKQLIQMSGYYDEIQHTWYFPINFFDFATVIGNTSDKSQYGFLKLQLEDLTWLLIPTSFPKKLIRELDEKSREQMSNPERWPQSKAGRGSVSEMPTGANNESIKVPSAILPSNLGASFGSKNSDADLYPSTATTRSRAVMPDAGDQTAKPKRLFLYTVRDEPQYQRKYVFAAYRETPQEDLLRSVSSSKSGKPKPMQYMLMHGGLYPNENYSMLMFTPIITRIDALNNRQQSMADSTTTLDSANHTDLNASDNMLKCMQENAELEGSRYASVLGSDTVIGEGALGRRDLNNSIDDGAQSGAVKLPGVPGTHATTAKFALQYSAGNSLKNKPHLLPYPNCPVAVIERDEDIHDWAKDHYANTREWIADKLKEAIHEDRLLNKERRKQQASGTSNSRSGSVDYSDDDNDEGLPGAVTPEPQGTAPRKSKGGSAKKRKKKSMVSNNASRSNVGKDDSGLASPDRKKSTTSRDDPTAGGRKDFFQDKGLEVYNTEELVARPEEPEGIADRNSMSISRTTRDVIPAGQERLYMQVKRLTEKQRLPSTVFQQRGSGGGGGNLADLGIAMAFVILRNAIDGLSGNTSPQARALRAHYRWRFLRTLVRTGEATYILYHATQAEQKVSAMTVTSVPGLLMAPELNIIGPQRPVPVPSRQVPYALPEQGNQRARFTEVSKSGMVVYHNMSRK